MDLNLTYNEYTNEVEAQLTVVYNTYGEFKPTYLEFNDEYLITKARISTDAKNMDETMLFYQRGSTSGSQIDLGLVSEQYYKYTNTLNTNSSLTDEKATQFTPSIPYVYKDKKGVNQVRFT
jgi:hypothetical protein